MNGEEIRKMIESNPMVDPDQLREAAKSWQELRQSGIDAGPGYRLASPFARESQPCRGHRRRRARQSDR